MSNYKVIRAETLPYQAGAYYVRIQAMALKHHIPPEDEFDEHDGPDAKYIMIYDDVLPVTTARLYPVDEKTMMLGRIVVLPEYRHQGLGSKAVLEAELWAKDLGYEKIALESRENKLEFYRKLGYIEDPARIIEGDTFTCVYMEKSIHL